MLIVICANLPIIFLWFYPPGSLVNEPVTGIASVRMLSLPLYPAARTLSPPARSH
ncbi:hypothetical protein [Pectobacterium versatile]|uniref:hypothetical protein n=1 Tax=Pectobacterium versatile TaxID=2488639 RepID=UPI0032EB0E82